MPINIWHEREQIKHRIMWNLLFCTSALDCCSLTTAKTCKVAHLSMLNKITCTRPALSACSAFSTWESYWLDMNPMLLKKWHKIREQRQEQRIRWQLRGSLTPPSGLIPTWKCYFFTKISFLYVSSIKSHESDTTCQHPSCLRDLATSSALSTLTSTH